MGKSNTALETAMRYTLLEKMEQFLISEGYDVLRIPLTDASTSIGYRLAVLGLDEENNERTLISTVSAARNKRNGDEFDPYEENEHYKQNVAAHLAKEEERKRKAEHKEAERQRKAELRKKNKKSGE